MPARSQSASARLGRALLLAVLAALALAGCSAQETTSPGGAYAPEFAAARQQATSDFERAVLADSRISRAEYDEAVHRLIDCAQARGVTIIAQDAGGIYTYSYSSPTGDRVMNECSIRHDVPRRAPL